MEVVPPLAARDERRAQTHLQRHRMAGGQEESTVEKSTMNTSGFGWTRTLTTMALVGGVVISSLLTGGAVDAKHKKHHKDPQTPPITTPQPPAITTDVSIVSVKVGPDGGDPTHRSVLVEVRNDGDVALSPFVIELSADRDGASRPPQASSQVTLGPNESQTVTYLAIGCKWLNGANHATLTAATNPNPVTGEDGPSTNNTLTTAPNLDFSGNPGCTGV